MKTYDTVRPAPAARLPGQKAVRLAAGGYAVAAGKPLDDMIDAGLVAGFVGWINRAGKAALFTLLNSEE